MKNFFYVLLIATSFALGVYLAQVLMPECGDAWRTQQPRDQSRQGQSFSPEEATSTSPATNPLVY